MKKKTKKIIKGTHEQIRDKRSKFEKCILLLPPRLVRDVVTSGENKTQIAAKPCT